MGSKWNILLKLILGMCFLITGAQALPIISETHTNEGFGIHTLVCELDNYKNIEEIEPSDIVHDDECEREVLAVSRGIAYKYVRVNIEGTAICVGCSQKFIEASTSCWIEASELKIGTPLLGLDGQHHTVQDMQIINEPVVLYALMVKSHSFIVTPHNLVTHNMDGLAIGTSTIVLEYVTLINPIAGIVGGAMMLAAAGQKAYATYTKQSYASKDTALEEYLTERRCFEYRKFELEKVKNELAAIKSGLQNIRPKGSDFTCSLFQLHIPQNFSKFFTISKEQEFSLSPHEKERLTHLRRLELGMLEREVIGLQFILALHMNELIVQAQSTYNLYQKLAPSLSNSIESWNTTNKLTKTQVIQGCESDFLEDFLVNFIGEKTAELKCAVEYYSRHGEHSSLKESTNIITLLPGLKKLISEREKWINENRQRINNNISISQQKCSSQRINIEAIKRDAVALLEKKKKETTTQALNNAENKLKKINSSSNGPEPEKKDDKKGRLKISEKDKGHIFRDSEGHFPKDTPEARALIEEMVNKQGNFKGLDKYGNEMYLQNLPDGSQLWAKARGGLIRWAGKNKTPWGYKPGVDLVRPS